MNNLNFRSSIFMPTGKRFSYLFLRLHQQQSYFTFLLLISCGSGGFVLIYKLYYYACHIICTRTIRHRNVSFRDSLVHHFFYDKWCFTLSFYFLVRSSSLRLAFFHSERWFCGLIQKTLWRFPFSRWFSTFLRATLSALPHELYSLLISETIPYSITSTYYEIMFIFFYRNFFDVWVRGHLVLFCFFNISIRRSCFCLLLSGSCSWCFCTLTFFHWLFFLHLLKEARILILPVSDCSWHSDNALNPTIFNKTATGLNSCHFSIIFGFVIMGKFNQLSILQTKHCSRIAWICAINTILSNENYTWSTSRLKCKALDLLLLAKIQFCSRTPDVLLHF